MTKMLFNEHRDNSGKLTSVDISFNKKVTLEIQGAIINLKTEIGFVSSQKCNPYAYYEIVAAILNEITREWEPKKKVKWKGVDIVPYNYSKWIKAKLGKMWGRKIHNYWLELLENMDPEALKVAKAIFIANFKYKGRAGLSFLKNYNEHDKYLLKDIMQYNAAAKWVQLSYESIWFDSVQNKSTDWMAFFYPDYKHNKAARKTIQNLPGGMPTQLLRRMRLVNFEHQITDRKHLIATIHMAHRAPRHTRVAMTSSPKEIKNGLRAYNDHNGDYGRWTFRKSAEIIAATNWIGDYPEDYNGNFIGLEGRSNTWHLENARRYRNAWSDYGKKYDEDTETIKPNVTITNPAITFLDTVGALKDESQKMHHCIASYASRAIRGTSYLFHIEHNGEHASAEVDNFGHIVQCHGPHNRHNKAVDYGKKELKKLFKDYEEKVNDAQRF